MHILKWIQMFPPGYKKIGKLFLWYMENQQSSENVIPYPCCYIVPLRCCQFELQNDKESFWVT